MASPFTVGPCRYLPADPPETPGARRDSLPSASPTHPALVERARGLYIDHLDEWERPVFVQSRNVGRARTAAASAARWRDYDDAARSDFLRRVVSSRWARTSRAERLAVVAHLHAAKRTRVAMLPSVLPVLRVVTTRGEVPIDQVRPEDIVCQQCGAPAALPYRPTPLRERVGIYFCHRHARILRARYADTGGVSLAILRARAVTPSATRSLRPRDASPSLTGSLAARTHEREKSVRRRRAK
jgi:hypothetical protein